MVELLLDREPLAHQPGPRIMMRSVGAGTFGSKENSGHRSGVLEQPVQGAGKILVGYDLASAFGRFKSRLTQELTEERCCHTLSTRRDGVDVGSVKRQALRTTRAGESSRASLETGPTAPNAPPASTITV